MRRVLRWAVLLVAAMLPAGCGWAKRPFDHDPLLRNGSAVAGDHGRARIRDPRPPAEPAEPRPPMPVELPTLEWESNGDGLRPFGPQDHLPVSGVKATVPLSWPVNTPLPSAVNTMQ